MAYCNLSLFSFLGKDVLNVVKSVYFATKYLENEERFYGVNIYLHLFVPNNEEILCNIDLLDEWLEIIEQKDYLDVKFGYTKLVAHNLDIDDIGSKEDFYKITKKVKEVIKSEKQRNSRNQRLFSDITSGRKTMSIVLYLVSCFMSVDKVYQLITYHSQVIRDRRLMIDDFIGKVKKELETNPEARWVELPLLHFRSFCILKDFEELNENDLLSILKNRDRADYGDLKKELKKEFNFLRSLFK